jgi:hypothetical protein
MLVKLFVEGISTNVRREERTVSGFIKFTTLGYGEISRDTWSELTTREAEDRKKEIEKAQPKLTVTIQPIHEVSS